MKRKSLLPLLPFILALFPLTTLFWFSSETRASTEVKNLLNFELQGDISITDVHPSSAPNDNYTMVVIQGSGFSATITGTQVLTVPMVYLGDVELPDVIWSSTTTLSATVPWKLPAQVYPLTVVNPDGGSATLTGRLHRDRQPAHAGFDRTEHRTK